PPAVAERPTFKPIRIPVKAPTARQQATFDQLNRAIAKIEGRQFIVKPGGTLKDVGRNLADSSRRVSSALKANQRLASINRQAGIGQTAAQRQAAVNLSRELKAISASQTALRAFTSTVTVVGVTAVLAAPLITGRPTPAEEPEVAPEVGRIEEAETLTRKQEAEAQRERERVPEGLRPRETELTPAVAPQRELERQRERERRREVKREVDPEREIGARPERVTRPKRAPEPAPQEPEIQVAPGRKPATKPTPA
ncbi:unnamed protein product, partial [marine sediment metagenome]